MFSSRLPSRTDVNALSRTLDSLRAARVEIVDLTESNPTRARFEYPPELLASLGDTRGLVYEPDPRGLPAAREAIAADGARRGATVDPANIVLCASTSEAYSWLFKLLCNPGDTVLVPQPSYPLFEQLTRLEGVQTVAYPLEYHGRWEMDAGAIERAPSGTRAVLLVSPNNPTGSYVSHAEFEWLTRISRDRQWALIVDEVFADYTLEARHPLTDLASRAEVLTFTLAGASKTLGLPQVKLGWIVVGGPADRRDAALSSLELIADSFLSVSTSVQLAAPRLLRDAVPVRAAIHARVANNLNRARAVVQAFPSCNVLRVEGGWTAPVRMPSIHSEEAMVLSLLERERVLVHPGYFFDFPHEAFIIVSLLAEETAFDDAFGRAMHFCAGMK